MAVNISKIKPMTKSYLFQKTTASKKMYSFVIESERIDVNSPEFEDIKFFVKKNQYTSVLSRLLENPNVILLINKQPMPRAFKVFAFTDVKENSKSEQIKIFIDVSEIINKDGSKYTIKHTDIDKFIAHLVSALGMIIYYGKPEAILNNNILLNAGTYCYAKLVANIIDYIGVAAVDKSREKVLYMAALFYQANVLMKDINDSALLRAEKISGLTKRETELIYTQMEQDCFDDINTFIKTVAKVLRTDKLNVDNFMDKWTFLYHVSTQFAVELYPAFNTMITNAYVGAYLNNQKTIEKLLGRDMVEYTKTLFSIGSELIK